MASIEEQSNKARGYKATLSNPNVSQEAKDNAQKELNRLDGGPSIPNEAEQSTGQNPGNVAGGLKAAINNPNVSDAGKDAAHQKLDNM